MTISAPLIQVDRNEGRRLQDMSDAPAREYYYFQFTAHCGLCSPLGAEPDGRPTAFFWPDCPVQKPAPESDR